MNENVDKLVHAALLARDAFAKIQSGMIKRGHAWLKGGDHPITPGMRKLKLKDAREIAQYQIARLNVAINAVVDDQELR